MKSARTIDWTTAAQQMATYISGVAPIGSKGIFPWPWGGFFVVWHDAQGDTFGLTEAESLHARRSMEAEGAITMAVGVATNDEGRKTIVSIMYWHDTLDLRTMHITLWVNGLHLLQGAAHGMGDDTQFSLNPYAMEDAFVAGETFAATAGCSIN